MEKQQLIVRKSDDHEDLHHHSTGWKVAYADFMTAMMAFFLLLWIISTTDQEKLEGLAEFFTPTETSKILGGEGFLDGQVFGPEGVFSGVDGDNFQIHPPTFGSEAPVSLPDDRVQDMQQVLEYTQIALSETGEGDGAMAAASMSEEEGDTDPASPAMPADRTDKLDAVEEAIAVAVAANAALVEHDFDLRIDRTPDGLLVQILDREGRPMFASGSARIDGAMRDLLHVIGQTVADLPYPLVITGHTDAVPFATRTDYGNWELSADRANSARRALVSAGVSAARIARVSGVADTMPLNKDVPTAPENRRLTMLLFYPDQTVEGEPHTGTYPDVLH